MTHVMGSDTLDWNASTMEVFLNNTSMIQLKKHIGILLTHATFSEAEGDLASYSRYFSRHLLFGLVE
jgi:hypothetical protein